MVKDKEQQREIERAWREREIEKYRERRENKRSIRETEEDRKRLRQRENDREKIGARQGYCDCSDEGKDKQ